MKAKCGAGFAISGGTVPVSLETYDLVPVQSIIDFGYPTEMTIQGWTIGYNVYFVGKAGLTGC